MPTTCGCGGDRDKPGSCLFWELLQEPQHQSPCAHCNAHSVEKAGIGPPHSLDSSCVRSSWLSANCLNIKIAASDHGESVSG